MDSEKKHGSRRTGKHEFIGPSPSEGSEKWLEKENEAKKSSNTFKYHISSNKCWASNKCHPLTSATFLVFTLK